MSKEKHIVNHKNGSFQVMIWHNGKAEYIGLYPTIKQAIIERDKVLKKFNLTNSSRTYQSHYFDNKIALYEMVVSKAQGRLSPKLLQMCMKVVKGVSRKFRYKNEDDRYDCEAYAIEMIIKNWHNFDVDKYDNVMAWVTEVVKRGFAMQFKILQKSRINTISLDCTNDEGKKTINI